MKRALLVQYPPTRVPFKSGAVLLRISRTLREKVWNRCEFLRRLLIALSRSPSPIGDSPVPKLHDGWFANDQEGDTSGSTGLVVLFDGRARGLIVANVGDSRCVASRAGVAGRLSSDHRLDRADERERVAVSVTLPPTLRATTPPANRWVADEGMLVFFWGEPPCPGHHTCVPHRFWRRVHNRWATLGFPSPPFGCLPSLSPAVFRCPGEGWFRGKQPHQRCPGDFQILW